VPWNTPHRVRNVRALTRSGRYGCSTELLELARSRPMWIEAGRIEDCLESWASFLPCEPVAIVYLPGLKSTETWVVPWG
jgi:hypothetical protein